MAELNIASTKQIQEESAQENVHNRLLTAVLETKPLPVHGSMETVKNECVEVYESVAAVISKDVARQLSDDEQHGFESYLSEKGGRLVRDGDLWIIYGCSGVVTSAKDYLSQMHKAHITPKAECHPLNPSNADNHTASNPSEIPSQDCVKVTVRELTDLSPSQGGDRVMLTRKAHGQTGDDDKITNGELFERSGIDLTSIESNCMSVKGAANSNNNTGTACKSEGIRGHQFDVLEVLGKRKRPSSETRGDIVTVKEERQIVGHSRAEDNELGLMSKKVKFEEETCFEKASLKRTNSENFAAEVLMQNVCTEPCVESVKTEVDASDYDKLTSCDINIDSSTKHGGDNGDRMARTSSGVNLNMDDGSFCDVETHTEQNVNTDTEEKVGQKQNGDVRDKGMAALGVNQQTEGGAYDKKPRLKLSKDVIRFLKKSKKKEQRGVRLEESSGEITEDDRTCQICGYVAASLQGIRLHNYTYHRDHHYQCDICFTTFPMRHMVDRHRKHHFDTDGKLKPSAISVHRMKLSELSIEENLPTDLAKQVSGDTTPLPEVKFQGVELSQGDEFVTVASQDGQWVECDICFARLSSEKFLRTHKLRVHSNNKEKKKTMHVQQQVGQKLGVVVRQQYYKCPLCEFTTTRIQNYTKHYNTHNKPAFYQCELCDYKNTVKAEIKRHTRNTHLERHLPCPYCQVKFRNQPQLNAHVKIKHLKHNSQMCEECGKVLSCKYSYKQHLKTHHDDPAIQPGDKIICQNCGRLFTTVGAFHTHQEKFHADVDENMLKEPKDVSEGVLVLNGGQLFQCKHCLTYTNSSAREVRLHIVRMHLEKTHACPYCEQAFARESFLEKHIATHHLYLYNVDCDECDRSFKNRSYLLFHKRRVHMKDLPFECEVCKKTFHRKVDYQSHIEIHKPPEERDWKFSCEICLKRFRHRNNLTYHMLEHTGVRAYHCPICKKSFKTKTIRNNHVHTHSDARPVECPLCDKTFKQSKYLDVHLLTHNSCSYSCKACCRLFPHLKALEKHVCRAVKLFNVEKRDSEILSTNMDIEGTSYTLQEPSDPNNLDPDSVEFSSVPQSEPSSYSTLILEPESGLYSLNPEGLAGTVTSVMGYLNPAQSSAGNSQGISSSNCSSLTINSTLSLGSLPSVITEDSISVAPETVIRECSDHSGSAILQQLHGINSDITVAYQENDIKSECTEEGVTKSGSDPSLLSENVGELMIEAKDFDSTEKGDNTCPSGEGNDDNLGQVKVQHEHLALVDSSSGILGKETMTGDLNIGLKGGGRLKEGLDLLHVRGSDDTESMAGVGHSEMYMCGECGTLCTKKEDINTHILQTHQKTQVVL